MPRIERKHLLEQFRAMVARKEPIVGAGAGTGLSAKCEEAGGADIIVTHLGLTTGGSIGAETALKLEDCPKLVDEWAEAARKIREHVIILCHGGPISSPDDAAYILKTVPGIHGFYGASSIERLPVETALTEQVRAFKRISVLTLDR